MSYNQKNSPKKLFAEAAAAASKKKQHNLDAEYQISFVNKNSDFCYKACFTEDNDKKMPHLNEKINQSYKQFVVRPAEILFYIFCSFLLFL